VLAVFVLAISTSAKLDYLFESQYRLTNKDLCRFLEHLRLSPQSVSLWFAFISKLVPIIFLHSAEKPICYYIIYFSKNSNFNFSIIARCFRFSFSMSLLSFKILLTYAESLSRCSSSSFAVNYSASSQFSHLSQKLTNLLCFLQIALYVPSSALLLPLLPHVEHCFLTSRKLFTFAPPIFYCSLLN